MPAWVDQATQEYRRRMPPEIKLELQEVKAEARANDGSASQCLLREAQRIRGALPEGARCVILDERGADLSSVQLSRRLAHWRQQARPIAIIIGGPDGLDASIKTMAHETVRLSSLTLPHALVRVLLAEQLFRACSILSNHPYHRA